MILVLRFFIQIQIEHENRLSIYENMNYYVNIEVIMSEKSQNVSVTYDKCISMELLFILWYID